MKKHNKAILLVGIGNDLREDDGIGYYLVKNFKLRDLYILYPEFHKFNLSELIKKVTVGFLDYSFCDYIKGFKNVIFIDSWINNNEKYRIFFSEIKDNIKYSDQGVNPFTHYVNIVNFVRYCRALKNNIYDISNQSQTKFFLLKVKGYSFGYKRGLTKEAKKNIKLAKLLLLKFLNFLLRLYL
jgi:hydrogenase maturation protease